MKLMIWTAQALVALTLLGSAIGAGAAVDKLDRVKAGKARETPHKELAEPIDGLQATSREELKSHCSSLKAEREITERELAERIRLARVAEGSTIDVEKLPGPGKVDIRNPPKPKEPSLAADSAAAKESKKAVAEALVRRTTIACLVYSVGQIQAGRNSKKAPSTKELVKRCSEGKVIADVAATTCDGNTPAVAPK